MIIRMNVTTFAANMPRKRGEEYNTDTREHFLSEDLAKLWVERGLAELVPEPEESGEEPPKRRKKTKSEE